MLVEVKNGSGRLPERKTTYAAGYDVQAYLPKDEYPDGLHLHPFEVAMVPTGLFVAPEPGTTILVASRSGLAAKGIIVVNGPGVVDSDYRGEIKVLLMLLSRDFRTFQIQDGDRIGQLLFIPPGGIHTDVQFVWTNELSDPGSNRTGGFGSTGK